MLVNGIQKSIKRIIDVYQNQIRFIPDNQVRVNIQKSTNVTHHFHRLMV